MKGYAIFGFQGAVHTSNILVTVPWKENMDLATNMSPCSAFPV